jgi:hypothetical protein
MASIEGAISEVETISRENDGKVVVSGTFKFETQNPASYWTVKLSPEQVINGIFDELKKYETPKDSWSKRPVLLNIGDRETSFNGQKFFSFYLDSIPSQNAKKA